MFHKRSSIEILLAVLVVIFFAALFVFSLLVKDNQEYSYLANSFLHSKLYFINQQGTWGDSTLFQGKYYWPLGVFPAILFIPFVFVSQHLGIFFYQGYLQFILVLIVFLLVYKISKYLKNTKSDSLFWAFGFCFSSVFIGVAFLPWSWQFSLVVVTLLEFLFIREFLTHKRYVYLGLLLGLLFATRATTIISLILILGDIFFSPAKLKKKVTNLKKLFLFFTPIGFLVFLYNYLRFGNIFEFGYTHQILHADFLAKSRDYGVFSIVHIPGNLYYFLLSGPLPVFKDTVSQVLKFPYIKANPFGMAFWVTSPVLLLLIFNLIKDKFTKLFLVTSFFIAIPIFLNYGIGFWQFGYRYSLDFLPFLYILLVRNYSKLHKKLSRNVKVLILLGALINIYLLKTLFMPS